MKDERVLTDPDFIVSPKFGNSLNSFLDRYPDGVSPLAAARVLGMDENEVVAIRDLALSKMREQI
jgi:hypothetical protein